MTHGATLETRSLVRIALFAALMGVLGLVPPLHIPIAAGVPVTAQSLGVMLAGLILGGRDGALSVALFLLVVALGAPLLSGGRGGSGVFFQPTAGYLLGYVAGAFVTGWLATRLPGPALLRGFAAAVIGGIGIVYLIGIPVFSAIARVPVDKVLIGSLIFIPGDLLKAALAALAARSVAGRTGPR
ncbi:biotin biosynthesis protein BioY [Azorhizobium oxalatiphilum]|uniref:Biotin transporter n=1 Tax=Azorhizobium oxalatiphilum TaxID=980631 RepID=A0A917F6V5_9HYPH|nr:biotin transporter BioY [Azorhizobium oxalatiphilum]GGF52090.1 biotin biosynthesis protein BioY [Azorhizobium oxalatiphilum]